MNRVHLNPIRSLLSVKFINLSIQHPANLQMRVAQLEEQNKRMDNEFNAQRARLKDLFLVKECLC